MSIPGFVRAAALTSMISIAAVAGAAAQTVVRLSDPGTHVSATTIQAGASANTKFSALDSIATSVGATPDDLRHALLKFDTQNTIPTGVRVVSAVLSLTVKSGGSDASRTVRLFPVTNSFVDSEATWIMRRDATAWTTAGGDFGPLAVTQTVSNAAGAKLSIDVTGLVQAAVSGATSSRYTRIGLVDGGSPSSGSIRRFYSPKALDPAVRPVLTVAYGGDAPNTAVTTPVTPVPTLRVLQYNTHHGGWGTDGVYDPNRIVAWIVKANPDVVSLNEVEVKTSWSKGADQTTLYQSLLQKATGRTWYKVFVNHAGWAIGNGNLILSKYPFIATATRLLPVERSALDVTISVNGRTINVTSTHLDSTSASNRVAELSELLHWETSLAEQRLILGDFNAWPQSSEIATIKSTYTDTWLTAQSLGTAAGNGITHGSHRIDYIFQSKNATYLSLASVQIFNTADAKGVKPSDHDPVLAVFRVK
jgi:endonuclease/exonuclease/phosphatase family metal-dependent hydrolase